MKCKCTVGRVEYTDFIEYCPLHDAAPDMYEACKTVIARITGTNVNTPIKDMSDTWDILKAAISKATGK